MQLKYSNYVAFSHFHGKAVNNSGLLMILQKYNLLKVVTYLPKVVDK